MKEQKIIIFCGADMTGKTEISKALSKKLDIPYFKASTEKNNFKKSPEFFINEMRYADPRMIDIIKQTGLSLIMDRGFPCEWVYSHAFNRETDNTATFKSDKEFSKLGAKIIICYRNYYDGLIDPDRPDLLIPSKLLEINDLYFKFTKISSCETYCLNVEDENIERELNEILSFIN
jgi:hypothetical protein